MNQDDIKELLQKYTAHLLNVIEEAGIECLYDETAVEEAIEEFFIANEELTGHLEEVEESE